MNLRFITQILRGVAAATRPPVPRNPAKRPSMSTPAPTPVIETPTPWYKSRTQLLSVAQTAIGIALALGLISPDAGTILKGNLEPIIGGVVALVGLVALWTHPTEVQNTAKTAAAEATVATAEVIVDKDRSGGPGAAAAAAKEIIRDA
jgi:hypothetical protein